MTNQKQSQALDERCRSRIVQTQTNSGIPLKDFYTPKDVQTTEYDRDLGDPGSPPYTRGIYADMYRGRVWAMRGISGLVTTSETNERFKAQMRQGFSALSWISDAPSRFGLDADHPLAEGLVARTGPSVCTLPAFLEMVDGVPLDKVALVTSNAQPATTAFYIAAAEYQGVDPSQLRGSLQSDILYSHLSRSQPVCDVDFFSLNVGPKLVADLVEYCARHMPHVNTPMVQSNGIREAGATAPQEVAFSMAVCKEYIGATLKRGLSIDDIAPRFSIIVNLNIDLFEEIAKLRAQRRMWAKLMKEHYGAKSARAMKLRLAGQGSGGMLPPQEPINNVIRGTIAALAGVLGGCQSIDVRPFDEPLAIPTEYSQKVALRTQQVIAYETGVARVADPLGGSWYIEALTNEIEDESWGILEEIDKLGGLREAIRCGWAADQIRRAGEERQREIETNQKILVGVNYGRSAEPDDEELRVRQRTYRGSPAAAEDALKRLREIKQTRDKKRVAEALANLRDEAKKGELVNLIPAMIRAAKASCTVMEIHGTVREAYGYPYDPFNMIEAPMIGLRGG